MKYVYIVLLALSGINVSGAVLTTVTNSIINPSALTLPDTVTFGRQANGQVFQQSLLASYSNRQYAAYYNSSRHVCVGRRTLPDGPWESIELIDYTMTSTDSHNNVSIGIAPSDGTIHLAFDHHVDTLHYRRSVAGALSSNSWNAALFGPITNALVAGTPLTITYPGFETTPAGNLTFFYRKGYPTNGDRRMHRYNGTTGTWDSPADFVSGAGTFTDIYGTNTSRSGYINPICFDKTGRVHASWVWREPSDENEPGSADNHDLMYLYSDDNGQTWKTGNGAAVSGGGRVDTPVITAVSIPRGYGLNNNSAMTVDNQCRVHVILRHCTDESLAKAGSYPGETAFGPVAARRLHHYWRDFDNTWHHTELPGSSGARSSALVADSSGNLFFARNVSGTLEILQATACTQWTDWKVIYTQSLSIATETLIDRTRWDVSAVFSLPYQETPSAWGLPSALRVADFTKNPDEPATPLMYRHVIDTEADAYVRSDGTQDGTGISLFVKHVTTAGFDRKTYLKFDTGKISSLVFSAVLKMHISTLSGPVSVSLYAVSDNSWEETGITWSNAPPFGEKAGSMIIEPGSTWVEWEITRILAVHTNRHLSLALWVDNPVAENLTFRSREYENGDFQPQLVIESTSPYTQWVTGHGVDESHLDPDADANGDGIPNLIAFSAGAASPTGTISALLDLIPESGGVRAACRRMTSAKVFNPRIEQCSSLTGPWRSVSEQTDFDYYGSGIDRISVLMTNSTGFFRYSVTP